MKSCKSKDLHSNSNYVHLLSATSYIKFNGAESGRILALFDNQGLLIGSIPFNEINVYDWHSPEPKFDKYYSKTHSFNLIKRMKAIIQKLKPICNRF